MILKMRESKIPRKKRVTTNRIIKITKWVKENNVPVAVVFEGRSYEKGSTIKKFTEYLDPKYYQIVLVYQLKRKKKLLERYEK